MFSNNIKKIREEKGLGVNELSRASGVNASYISALERGEKENPTINTLNKIADALEVPLDYLTRKSAKAVIEDKLEELDMTFEELSAKIKVPIVFFEKLDDITPDEGDYQKVQRVANALNIEPKILLNALYRQEPPIYEGSTSSAEEDFDIVKEDVVEYDSNRKEFKTAEEAIQYILKENSIAAYGGYDINKMTDDEIIEFANELLRQIELISYKYKK